MDWAPLVRIAVRYAAGALLGAAGADALKTNLDLENALVMAGCAAVAGITEWLYAKAKAKGWTL
jgi:hypothetical protein